MSTSRFDTLPWIALGVGVVGIGAAAWQERNGSASTRYTPDFFWTQIVPSATRRAAEEKAPILVTFEDRFNAWGMMSGQSQPRTRRLFAVIDAKGHVEHGPAWDASFDRGSAAVVHRAGLSRNPAKITVTGWHKGFPDGKRPPERYGGKPEKPDYFAVMVNDKPALYFDFNRYRALGDIITYASYWLPGGTHTRTGHVYFDDMKREMIEFVRQRSVWEGYFPGVPWPLENLPASTTNLQTP